MVEVEVEVEQTELDEVEVILVEVILLGLMIELDEVHIIFEIIKQIKNELIVHIDK